MKSLWYIWVWILAWSILWTNLSDNPKEKINQEVNTKCSYSEEIIWVKLEYCYQIWKALNTKYVIRWIDPDWTKQDITSFDIQWPILLDKDNNELTRCFVEWIDRFVNEEWKIIKPEEVAKNPELEKTIQKFWINPEVIKNCLWIN